MQDSPGIFDYLQSPYIVEVVVALLLGWFLLSPWRLARRLRWQWLSGWRRFSFVVAWVLFVLAILAWLFLLFLTMSALHTSLDPTVPKPWSLVFLLIGGFAYLMIAGFASLAFSAAAGAGPDDQLR